MKFKENLSEVLRYASYSFVALSIWALPTVCVGQNADKTLFNHTFAPSEGMVNRTEAKYREEICLNGYWDFQPVNLPSVYKQGDGVAPLLDKPLESGWCTAKIKIPSPWNVNSFTGNVVGGPDMRCFPSYPMAWEKVKMGWLRRTVKIPSNWGSKEIYLHFEAVAGYADVYINGVKVGENFDIFLPFDIDITKYASPGNKLEIMVGVRSQQLFENNHTVGRRILPAGSMWGQHIIGIWQDVYLTAKPKINVTNLFVKPLVGLKQLLIQVSLENNTNISSSISVDGDVYEWLNHAGTDVVSAPEPNWELGKKTASITHRIVVIKPYGKQTVTLTLRVADNMLNEWTPEHPNLYALLLSLKQGSYTIDMKYERFGWREWTINGTQYCLNGKPYPLRGDSWHFMGIPQMTRRYAWAWYHTLKDINGNAVRLHAQVYPRFYMDMADEMGICVLDETANWASDGGPKLDSDTFWSKSKEHLNRFVLRDRNHPSVFGWSISNENKPVILYVYKKPELLVPQKKAWQEWCGIVKSTDPTRPWISSDGEDDGDGVLPVTVGHYGDSISMAHWRAIGKPWGVGEHSMAYYGTPEQVSVYNGEQAFVSQKGRMEGLANECYNLITVQRKNGAAYSSVFNMVWYALQPLALGKRDLNKATTSTDGIYFPKYVEGVPGVQPERIGPYSTTLNPGYDPNLPLYQPWPMFDAMRAANSDGRSAWSSYAEVDKKQYLSPENIEDKKYENVIFVGEDTCALKKIFISQGVIFVSKSKNMQKTLFVIDGSKMMASADKKLLVKGISKGADVWIWGPVPATISTYNSLLPLNMSLDSLVRSSFIPQPVSWTRGLNNSDFYFCELQKTPVARYTLKGKLVDEGNVMLEACRTDWRQWNKQPEPTKTATVLTSERECTAATPVMVRYRSGVSTFYISTLTNFTGSERGYKTFAALLKNAGVECSKVISNRKFVGRDKDYTFLEMPPSSTIEDKNDSMAPNPFVRSIFTADPSARVWKDGRLYVYCSHDIAPPRGCDLMDQYHVFSTDDMLHWTDHGEILRASQVPWGRKEGGFMWAPDCQYHKGKYYFFFPHPSETVTDHSWKVGVAVSKYPAKDFKVVGYIKGAPSYIDPCVFVDDDGQAYLYNGGGGVCMGGRLKSNLMEVDGEMDTMQGLRDFHEGTWVFKRNGKYYLTYADNYVAPNGRQANRLNYAIANSPLGPWKYQGIYLEPTDCDTSHGSVVEYRGQWYAFYHCCTLSGRGNLRSVCVDKLYFNSDGTIRMVKQRPRIK